MTGKRLLYVVALPALVLASGCATPDPHAAWRETVTQVATYSGLAAGGYEGQIACSNLLAYGDTGLGTYDGLDGEMVVLDGRAYQVSVDGTVSEASPAAPIPFADVTWFEPDTLFDTGPMNQTIFQNTMRWKLSDTGQAYGVRVHGVFASIKVRSVPRQEKPYPPLAHVVPEHQREFELKNVEGTMVGFLLPDNVSPLMPPGFHLHFLTDDRKAGGHVLDFELSSGRIELDETRGVHILLPQAASQP